MSKRNRLTFVLQFAFQGGEALLHDEFDAGFDQEGAQILHRAVHVDSSIELQLSAFTASDQREDQVAVHRAGGTIARDEQAVGLVRVSIADLECERVGRFYETQPDFDDAGIVIVAHLVQRRTARDNRCEYVGVEQEIPDPPGVSRYVFLSLNVHARVV